MTKNLTQVLWYSLAGRLKASVQYCIKHLSKQADDQCQRLKSPEAHLSMLGTTSQEILAVAGESIKYYSSFWPLTTSWPEGSLAELLMFPLPSTDLQSISSIAIPLACKFSLDRALQPKFGSPDLLNAKTSRGQQVMPLLVSPFRTRIYNYHAQIEKAPLDSTFDVWQYHLVHQKKLRGPFAHHCRRVAQDLFTWHDLASHGECRADSTLLLRNENIRGPLNGKRADPAFDRLKRQETIEHSLDALLCEFTCVFHCNW